MDPQACLQRIFDASNQEEFDSAMEDLANWLKGGGFAPVVTTLGVGDYGPHKWMGNRIHALMTKEVNGVVDGQYVFKVYNYAGDETHSFDMRTN